MHHFKYCLTPKKKLEETCNLFKLSQKKSKLDVKTRLGSTLKMIQRYIILEPAVEYLYSSNKSLNDKEKDRVIRNKIYKE